MLTDSKKDILSGVDPNLIKLSDTGFKSNLIQYNTNYFIFLDKNIIKEQTHLNDKFKNEIEIYMINNKDDILDNFNKVLQNYKK